MYPKILRVINFIKNNHLYFLIGGLIFTSSTSIYFQHKFSELSSNPQKAVQDETKRMINKISELIVLPDNEQPTIATVSDPELLRDQPFFAKAKKGFKVLIYADAGRSILYDPFQNKVVETASMNIGAQITPTPNPTPLPPIPIRKK